MVLAEDWMRRVRFLPLCTFELLDSLHHRISSLFSPAFLFGRSQPLDENVGQTIFLHGSAPVKKTWIFRKSPSVGLLLLPAFVALSVGWALTQNVPSAPDLKVEYSVFQNPPTEFRGHAWLDFRLGNISDDIVNTMVDQAIHSNSYGGFMITSTGARPGDPSNVVYLSDEYFRLYRLAIERGLKGNLPLDVLYDEQQFPTGMAGGQFAAKYPQLVAKSLEKVERDVTGPAKVELQAPIANGIYIGAVRMNLDTLDCVDISDKRLPGRTAIDCRVPSGRWKVMLFYLDPALRRGLCDYLDPQAVDKLIEIMYQAYYDHLKEFFGVPAYGPMTAAIRAYTDDFKTFFAHANASGGKAFFVPQPEPKILDGILKEAVPVRDVDIQQPPVWPVKMNRAYEGALTYIHKIKDGRDIYFFANSSDNPVDADVVLRGKKNLAIWNPHTGERSKAQVSISENAGQPATRVRLVLPAVTSVFFVEEN
jgi:hypothetical protein